MPRHSDDSRRALEILTLNEILRRQRPDLRFVPLESLIGLVVRRGKAQRSQPPRLARLFKAVQRQVDAPTVDDLVPRTLEQMLVMPPDPVVDLGVQGELTVAEFRALMRQRTGFELSEPGVPTPVPTRIKREVPGLPDTPLEFIFKKFPRSPKGLATLACVAAAPFLGRAILSPDPRIQAGAIAGALACGFAVDDVLE